MRSLLVRIPLISQFRDAVGLRTEYSGAHWPGSGSAGQPYQERSAQRLREPRGVITTPSVGEERPEEVCVFLTDTETSVRGFLALARREAEAGWYVPLIIVLLGANRQNCQEL